MRRQVVQNVNLNRDDVSEMYGAYHKYQAFLSGTWTPVRVSVVQHRYEMANMVMQNDLVVENAGRKGSTYFTQKVAMEIESMFGDVLDVRCMQ